MPPELRKTALSESWEICTRIKKYKNGLETCDSRYRYKVPDSVVEQIALSWIVKEMEGCKNGFDMGIRGKNNEKLLLSVRRGENND